MPSTSQVQQEFMGAELARKRAGKKTRTGMSEAQLEDFASTKRKGLPKRAKKMCEGGVVATNTHHAVIGKPKDHANFKQLGIGYG